MPGRPKGFKKNKLTGKYEQTNTMNEETLVVEEPVVESPIDEVVEPTPIEETGETGEVCTQCRKPLTAFVASNGKRFCSDACVRAFYV